MSAWAPDLGSPTRRTTTPKCSSNVTSGEIANEPTNCVVRCFLPARTSPPLLASNLRGITLMWVQHLESVAGQISGGTRVAGLKIQVEALCGVAAPLLTARILSEYSL